MSATWRFKCPNECKCNRRWSRSEVFTRPLPYIKPFDEHLFKDLFRWPLSSRSSSFFPEVTHFFYAHLPDSRSFVYTTIFEYLFELVTPIYTRFHHDFLPRGCGSCSMWASTRCSCGSGPPRRPKGHYYHQRGHDQCHHACSFPRGAKTLQSYVIWDNEFTSFVLQQS